VECLTKLISGLVLIFFAHSAAAQRAGRPEYRLDLSSWGKGSAAAGFAFEPPAGAKLSDIRESPDLDEVAGVFVIKEAN
jgi:hypothetical protein